MSGNKVIIKLHFYKIILQWIVMYSFTGFQLITSILNLLRIQIPTSNINILILAYYYAGQVK